MKWIKVFKSEEEANEHFQESHILKVVISDKELCLVRFQNKYFAISDICPHQYESLSRGNVTSYGEIVCPLHFYRFDIKSGVECENRTKSLKTYPIRNDEDGLFIFC